MQAAVEKPSPIQKTVTLEEHKKALREIEYLKYQLAEMRRLLYGSKSERFEPSEIVLPVQLSLFDDSEAPEGQPEVEHINYSRKKPTKEKQAPVRVPIPANLPRVEEVIEPDGIDENSVKIGEEITEVLEYQPSHIYVRKIVRPKYALPNNQGVAIAGQPSLPIPKGNAAASLLAYILVSKFIDHLPFYRQIQIFKRQNVLFSKSTLNGWFSKSTELLEILYDALVDELLNNDYLQADESPIGVQDPSKKGKLFTGYHWVFRSPLKRLVLFKYHPGRERKVPENMLLNFTGTLQTDGYAGYKNMTTKGHIALLGCMAHARRYFDKAKDNDKKRAEHVLTLMQRLYRIERDARERAITAQTRKRYRDLYAKPILNELHQWLKANTLQVLPKSSIGKAINYTLGIWTNLCRYLEDGRYEIDNNRIENTIRPMAVGRKNYLFAGSHNAAQKAAMMYSFFATCKEHDVDPLEWLTDVLNRIPAHKANKVSELLPHNWKKQKSRQ